MNPCVLDSKLLPLVPISRILFKSSPIFTIFYKDDFFPPKADFPASLEDCVSHTFHTLQHTWDATSEIIIWLPLSFVVKVSNYRSWCTWMVEEQDSSQISRGTMCASGTVMPEARREVTAPRGAIYTSLEMSEKHLCWIQPDLRGCGSTHAGGYSCLFSSCHFVNP